MSDITEFAEPVNPTEYNNVVTIIRNSFKVIPSLVCLLTNSQERSQIHTSLLRFPPYLLCRPTTPHRKSSSWYFSVLVGPAAEHDDQFMKAIFRALWPTDASLGARQYRTSPHTTLQSTHLLTTRDVINHVIVTSLSVAASTYR